MSDNFDPEKLFYRFFNSKQTLFSSNISKTASLCPKNVCENRRQKLVKAGSQVKVKNGYENHSTDGTASHMYM